MATTDFSVNLAEVQKYQPDIAEFGITNFDTQLQFAEDDVIRQIREEWWERYRHTVRYKDITKITSLELVNSKLLDAQWKRCVVYKALAEYIMPQLTKWKTPEGDNDAFQVQIDFYRASYATEFQAILRDGVSYDENSDGTIQDSEKEPIHHLRLVR